MKQNRFILSVFLGLTLVLVAFILPQYFHEKTLNPQLTTSQASGGDIVINARGTNGKEKIALYINNTPVNFWNLTNSFKDYTYTPNGEITVSELSIHFLNDTWEPEKNINYDVQIPYIEVNGEKFESQHEDVTSTGSWDQENWCSPGNKKTQWLNCTGSFTYNIPKGTKVGINSVSPFTFTNLPEVRDLRETSVRIAFTLSEKSPARTEIGTTQSLGTIGHRQDSFNYDSHVQLITDLQPGTAYFFKVIGTNANGVEVESSGSFTTLGTPPPPMCGNSIKESGEGCDDGNTLSGDGCSAQCQKEEVGGGEKINTLGAPGTVKRILDDFRVSQSHTNTQMETIDVKNGNVYIAYIEAGSQGDGGKPKLHNTVVAKGTFNEGSWSWQKNVVDRRTAFDVWHNAPTIVVDNDGYIHVAYNMHNLPWQYKVSKNPHDITSWEFKGQSITDAEFNRYYLENKTSFPTNGTASIPGNQVSYPAFYKDNAGEIYVTYRFAAQPKRSFADRMMSSGVSRYDTESKSWSAIGAEVSTSASADFDVRSGAPNKPTVFAGQEGWTAYFPKLAFDEDNTLHFTGVWRSGIAGAVTGRPCYLRSFDQRSFKQSDGSTVALPLRPSDCPNISTVASSKALNSIGSFAVTSDGTPHFLTFESGGSIEIHTYTNGSWRSENAPNRATEIFIDGDDVLYAISSNMTIHKKIGGSWQQIHSGGTCGYFNRVALNADKSIAYIHTHGCTTNSSVYGVQLK